MTIPTCWYPGGVVADGDSPCNPTAQQSNCCGPSDICLANNLCFVANLNALHRGVRTSNLLLLPHPANVPTRAAQMPPGAPPHAQPTFAAPVHIPHPRIPSLKVNPFHKSRAGQISKNALMTPPTSTAASMFPPAITAPRPSLCREVTSPISAISPLPLTPPPPLQRLQSLWPAARRLFPPP